MTCYSLFCGRDPVALGIEDETGGWSIDALRAHIETCPICRCGTERLTEAMDMSLAAAVLGKSRSPKKTAAARANGAKGGRPMKRVQLINPWSGALPEDKNLTWDEIRAWAQGHVHPDDLPWWLRRARQAFRDNDGAELGTMIIGS